MSVFDFRILGMDGCARCGEVATSHGIIRTPAFMPVGTQATVKAVFPEQVRAAGVDVILGNTYHLMLRPGAERIARLGGLHRFMNWFHPILTDSGGFQVMSLSSLRTIEEEGVTFRSHVDGSRHLLTPERAVEIQRLLGSDIQMQLDECLALPCRSDEAACAMRRSLRWAERARSAFEDRLDRTRALFGIVQGGISETLRVESACQLRNMAFEGYAIGGLAVGESREDMLRVLRITTPFLPEDKPRYLMGVGSPKDILSAVACGIDMFDCVLPTRAGRHGQAYTPFGRLNLRNARYAEDQRPLDSQSSCPAANSYSRAYLHHLLKAREYLGGMLLSWANIAYYQDLMGAIRRAVHSSSLREFSEETLRRLEAEE